MLGTVYYQIRDHIGGRFPVYSWTLGKTKATNSQSPKFNIVNTGFPNRKHESRWCPEGRLPLYQIFRRHVLTRKIFCLSKRGVNPAHQVIIGEKTPEREDRLLKMSEVF
jgi:hypothetical protein